MMIKLGLGLGLGLTSLSWAPTALTQGENAINCRPVVCKISIDSFDFFFLGISIRGFELD